MKKELEKTTHYLTYEELAKNLFLPKDGKEQFPAAQKYLDENGFFRFNDPEAVRGYVNEAIQDEPSLKNVLVDFEDAYIKSPSYYDMLSTNIGNIPNLIKTAKGVGQIHLTQELKGTTADELPYVSQEEYRKRKNAGETAADIFPQLTEDSARTYTDWLFWAVKKPSEIKFDDPNRILPNATERLRMREQWYNEGGEVGPDGKWYNVEERTLPSGQKQTIKTPSNFNRFWTPLEYKTEKQYEQRKNENLTWNEGVLNSFRQKFAYEYMDPINDAVMDSMLKDRLEAHLNNPRMQELQEWSKSVEWSEAFEKGELTKKVVNAVTGALPSYLIQIGAGVGAGLLFKSPSAGMTTSAIIGAGMDSSDMYLDAYQYARDKGFSDEEAKVMAAAYFENYFLASMALERLPFMLAFRRMNKDPNVKRGLIRKFFGDNFNKKIDDLANTKLYSNVTAGDFGRLTMAAITQGVAESVTEISQYTTQMAMQTGQPIDKMFGFELPFEFETGGYREEQKFDDLADINTLLDAAVGGFGMGGATGIFTPQVSYEKIQPKAPPGSQIGGTPPTGQAPSGQQTQKSTTTITQPITQQGTKGASPTARDMSTYNEVEYLEDVVTVQMGEDPDLLGEDLATQMINSGRQDKFANKVISHQKKKFEEVPLQKVVEIVNEYGLGVIDKTNLDKDVKENLKSEVLEEIKRKKGVNLRNKSDLTTQEKKKLENIDNLTVDDLIKAGENNVDIDKIISQGIDKAIKSQEEKIISQAQEPDIDVDETQGVSQEQIDAAAQAAGTKVPAGAERKTGAISGVKGPVGKADTKTQQAPTPSKQKAAPKITDKQLNDKITEANDRAIKTAPGKDLTNPEVMAEIDELRKERVARIKLKYKKKTPKQLETLQKSLSKPSSMKDQGIREDSLKAIEELQEERKPFAKDKKSKAAEEANLIDSPNFYVESEKSIVSKLNNKRLDEVIKEKKEKRDKESEGLDTEEVMQLAAEIQSLESEKERRQETAKAKKEKQDVSVKSKKEIKLEQSDDDLFAQYLSANPEMGSVRDVGKKTSSEAALTQEQKQELETQVEETKEELNKKNCKK